MGNFIKGFSNTLFSLIEFFSDISKETNDNNTSNADCVSPSVSEWYYYGLVMLSFALVVVFSFMSKRASFKTNVCQGRPGLVVPMDVLNSHNNIVEYVLAFLSLSEDIYQLIFNSDMNLDALDPIGKFFIKLFSIILISIVSYPIFGAIYGKFLFGYISAGILWILYLSFNLVTMYNVILCIQGTPLIPFLIIMLTRIGIDISLILIFFIKIIKHFRYPVDPQKEHQSLTRLHKKEYFEYVRQLFKQNQESEERIDNNVCCHREYFKTLKSQVKSRVYLRIQGFRIPPRLIIGLFVGLYFAFRIFMDQIYEMTPTTWKVINLLNKKLKPANLSLGKAFKILNDFAAYPEDKRTESLFYLIIFYINLFIGCFILAIIFGFVNSFVQSFLVLRSYRLQFRRLTKRGFSSIISLKDAPSPSTLLYGFIQYSGFQAMYILWGIVVVIGFVFIFSFLLLGVVLIPCWYVPTYPIRVIFNQYILIIVTSILLSIFQNLLVRFVFVQGYGSLLAINNRRALMIYTHISFFLNALVGFFYSIIRIIVWILSGVFCFCRIDFSVLPVHMRTYDGAYMKYIGFLYTEQYHHNPILKCFLDLLQDSYFRPSISLQDSMKDNLTRTNFESPISKYKNKWLVAYTLIKNPQLKSKRKIDSLKAYDNGKFDFNK